MGTPRIDVRRAPLALSDEEGIWMFDPEHDRRGERGRSVPALTSPAERTYDVWSPTDPAPTDDQISADLRGRLRRHPSTRQAGIAVEVRQRVVILRGRVATPFAKRVAGDRAWDTPGVLDVDNRIRLSDVGDGIETEDRPGGGPQPCAQPPYGLVR